MAGCAAASSQERLDVGFRAPFEPTDTGLNDFISCSQMLSKEISLIFVHEIDNLIILSYHNHRILSQHSKIFFVVHHKLIGFVGDTNIERN